MYAMHPLYSVGYILHTFAGVFVIRHYLAAAYLSLAIYLPKHGADTMCAYMIRIHHTLHSRITECIVQVQYELVVLVVVEGGLVLGIRTSNKSVIAGYDPQSTIAIASVITYKPYGFRRCLVGARHDDVVGFLVVPAFLLPVAAACVIAHMLAGLSIYITYKLFLASALRTGIPG
jgi:hypothetical protein